MPKVSEIIGLRFGRLIVSKHLGKGPGKSRNHFWLCQCDCGVSVSVNGSCLRSGQTKSCGCFQKDIAKSAGDRTKTHGMTKTTTYNVWATMIQRCHNPNAKDYPRYGARGIFVCDEWRAFDIFLKDMGERPVGKSLDREDNEKGYSPKNCRWVDAVTQQRNKRNNRTMTHNGKTMTLAGWAETLNINPNTLNARLQNGWDEISAITMPIEKKYSHQKNMGRHHTAA